MIDELLAQPLDVPLIFARALVAVLVEQGRQNPAHVILENQLALLYTLQQLPAQAVHRLALLVHHVVVLE